MDDFSRLCAFENLYQAHLKTRLGKRHKAEVIRFETDLGQKLVLLSDLLQSDAYLPVKYFHFKVFEPKERDIHALRYPDRVVQRCLCDQVLSPLIEPRLIFDDAACRRGKGMHFSLERLAGFMRGHYRCFGTEGYYLKCDISKYFQSIDHEVLKQLLERLPTSDHMRSFLHGVVDSFELSPGKGLPLGNQSSQLFALFYLDPIDRLVKEKLGIKHYVRYMDDFILIHPDKSYLVECRKQIEKMLESQLQLRLNSKTQLAPLNQGIHYLGFIFRLTETGKVVRRIVPATKKRIVKSLRMIDKGLARGIISEKKTAQTLASYLGHLQHGDCQSIVSEVRWCMKKSAAQLEDQI